MNQSSNKKIVNHLRNAVFQRTPDQADQLWEQPVVRATGDEWYLDGTSSKQRSIGRMVKIVSALAACFLICVVSVAALNMHSNAAVYLDVNPSVSVQINCFDRVVSAHASNEDGAVILEDMNLKNTDINVALNAILGSMVKHGYLNENNGTVLVSVECSNQERADKLRVQVSDRVEADMTSLIHSGTVLSQQVQTDDTLEQLAEKFGMTQGKAALLQTLVEENPKLSYEELAELSMSELLAVLHREHIDIDDHFDYYEDIIPDFDDDFISDKNDHFDDKYDDKDDLYEDKFDLENDKKDRYDDKDDIYDDRFDAENDIDDFDDQYDDKDDLYDDPFDAENDMDDRYDYDD